MAYHKPVLLDESIEGLCIKPGGVYVDLTFGGGGHSREVLKKLGRKGKLIGFDQDPDAEANVPDDKRFSLVQANFRFLRNFLRYMEVEKVNGILVDLGISSHQIDRPERGFSFRSSDNLDMRMNTRSGLTAEQLLEEYTQNDLQRVFRQYGELKNAGRLASLIVKAREGDPLNSPDRLEQALGPVIPKQHPSKFLAKVYQAIRIEVNKELEALREMLPQTIACMEPGGRLVIISYHSIEDRMVKNFLRSGNLEGDIKKDFYGNIETPWKLIHKGVITPGEEELLLNNRSRSAKLRIAERI